MPRSYWREEAAHVIAEVVREVGPQGEKALLKALRDAYPFGERAMWPHKAWLAERKLALARYRGVFDLEDTSERRERLREMADSESAGQQRLPEIK